MSDTPRTDAVALDEREGITHPELHETYMAWTDYWALRELARQLERELAAAKARVAELESQNRMVGYAADAHSKDADKWADAYSAIKAERDALRAELEAARKSISDLYEVVRAFAHVAQHGPHDPSPLDENSPLMDAVRDVLAKVGA